MSSEPCSNHGHLRCFECYRAARERMRTAQPVLDAEPGEPMRFPITAYARLTLVQAGHRRRMLAHLQTAGTS